MHISQRCGCQYRETLPDPSVSSIDRIEIQVLPLTYLFIASLYQQLEALLDQVEEISVDSKLDALITFARNFFDTERKTFLCICCSYVKTIQYLGTSLEILKKPTYLLTGSLEQSELKAALESFQKNGGILLATDISLKGVSFEFVEECVSYDLPLNALTLYLRWTRFNRISRKTDFRMSVLKDDSKALPWEENLLKVIENSISSEDLF